MKLLSDIINSALESPEALPDILRKCLVLAYQLKNDRLKLWVEKELNGYGPDDELPSYRKVRALAKGHFFGVGGAEIRNQPIPPAILKPQHRHFAETAELRQPIAAYDIVRTSEKGEAIIEWPPDLTIMYQAEFFEGDYALNRAWQEIPDSVIPSLVDTVRTRILTFALELRDEIGAQPETEATLKEIPAPKIDSIVTNYIFGGTNVIAAKDGQMTVDARTQVVAGDLETLRKALQEFGVASKDVKLLETALNKDTSEGKNTGEIGPKTSQWLSTAAKKVGGSTVKVTEAVATSVISGMIKGFLGY